MYRHRKSACRTLLPSFGRFLSKPGVDWSHPRTTAARIRSDERFAYIFFSSVRACIRNVAHTCRRRRRVHVFCTAYGILAYRRTEADCGRYRAVILPASTAHSVLTPRRWWSPQGSHAKAYTTYVCICVYVETWCLNIHTLKSLVQLRRKDKRDSHSERN